MKAKKTFESSKGPDKQLKDFVEYMEKVVLSILIKTQIQPYKIKRKAIFNISKLHVLFDQMRDSYDRELKSLSEVNNKLDEQLQLALEREKIATVALVNIRSSQEDLMKRYSECIR